MTITQFWFFIGLWAFIWVAYEANVHEVIEAEKGICRLEDNA